MRKGNRSVRVIDWYKGSVNPGVTPRKSSKERQVLNLDNPAVISYKLTQEKTLFSPVDGPKGHLIPANIVRNKSFGCLP